MLTIKELLKLAYTEGFEDGNNERAADEYEGCGQLDVNIAWKEWESLNADIIAQVIDDD